MKFEYSTLRIFKNLNLKRKFILKLCIKKIFNLQLSIQTIGVFARLFGQNFTEKCLIPHLEKAIHDVNFSVRKVCGEIFVDVALNASAKVRSEVLSPKFLVLLSDSNRMVSILKGFFNKNILFNKILNFFFLN